VTFSESISAASFVVSDLLVSGTSGTVTSFVQVDGRTWTAEVTGMTSGDMVQVSLPAARVNDPAGNANIGSTSTDNQVVYDSTRPLVTVNQAAAQPDPTNVDLAVFDIVFNEDVFGVDVTDFQLSGSSTAAITGLIQVTSTTWRIEVTGMTSGDTIQLVARSGEVSDAAGNTNMASTSTDNSVSFDNTPPLVSITVVATNDTTPQLGGTINDPSATVTVTVNGQTYPAINNGDGTWTLADNTVSPALGEAIYDVQVVATDTLGNSAGDSSTNELTIDTTAPTGSVNAVPDGTTNSPEMSGLVDDPTTTVTVTVNGQTYPAINNGDGTWTLPAGAIAPGLAIGTHTADVLFTDLAGNTLTQSTPITVLRADADVPTVTATNWLGGQPIIQGTFDSVNSLSLTVRLAGKVYILGIAPELTVSGNSWTLNLTALSPPLAEGEYDVSVEVTTRSGGALGDITTQELVVLAISVPSVVLNLGAGVTLANTGIPVWEIVAVAAGLLGSGIVLLFRTKSAHLAQSVL
jgi:hypothetical protein